MEQNDAQGTEDDAPLTKREHSAHGTHKPGQGIPFPLVPPGYCQPGVGDHIGEGEGPATETHSHNWGVTFHGSSTITDDNLVADGFAREDLRNGIMIFKPGDGYLYIRLGVDTYYRGGPFVLYP